MNRDDEIFGQAIDLPAAERTAFVERACADDAALRGRIAALLAAHGQPWNYLETLARRPIELNDEKPGDVIGRYKLLQKIGEGGCGTVFMAEQEEPVRRRVALKVIKLGMDTKEVIARFSAERQALAMMDHPNIARVLEAGATEAGRPFFAMELVRGVPITRYCDEQNLPTAQRLQLFVQVCQAVQHAHQKGIVHRDLKPSNILVTLHDGVPVPKVIDFGIAKATQGRLTAQTIFTAFAQFIGTPAYMSPEQAELSGLDIDTRSDIYSLGVLLYELLTGRTPFDSKELLAVGLDEMRRRIREVEPPPPSTRLSTLEAPLLATAAERRHIDAPKLIHLLRGDLDWIVMRCLEKDRTRRYETAVSLAQDLQRHLANEPVLARPPSAGYRLRKMAQRHRLAFAAGAVVLVSLLVGLGLAAWSFAREREARVQAKRLLYAADMNLAQRSLQANNLARARLLLDRHRPARAGEADLRGWEWRYLWQQTRTDALATLTQQKVPVFAISAAPDGRRFAVGYANGRIELWDATTRKLERVLVESASAIGRVAFSPRGDALVATVGPGVIEWHDLASGSYAVRCRVRGSVRDLVFSTDGSRLAVRTAGPGAVHVVDPANGEVLFTRETPHNNEVYLDGVALSPDGALMYYSELIEGRPVVRCVRVADNRKLWEIDGGPHEGISALALSPDGRFLATATGYERDAIRVLDAASGTFVAKLEGHSHWVARLAFSGDGRMLVSVSSDQTARIWDASTWRETAVLRGHVEEVFALGLSPDGKTLMTGAEDGTVMLWNTETRGADGGRRVLPGHVESAWALPGGKAVLAKSAERAFSVIDLATLRETPLPAEAPERRFFVPPNFFADYDGRARVQVYAITAYGREPLGEVNVGPKFEGGFAYHAGRRLFAWADGGRVLHVVDLAAPEQRTDLEANLDQIWPLNFTPDGHVVRAWWTSSRGIAWEVETRRRLEVSDTGYVVTDRRSASIGTENRPLLPIAQMLKARQTLRSDPALARMGPLTGIALSPDGKTFAAASETGLLGLCDYHDVANYSVLAGNMQDVDGVAFSPDGRRLATTGHGDEMVKLWDVETRQELLTLAGRGAEIYAVTFTDDTNTILVGRRPFAARPFSGLCQFWTAPSWAEIATAERTEAERAKIK